MPAADLCFLASSKSGLGHLRRLATIARRVPDVAPGRRVHLISYALPEGLAEADLSAFASVLVRDRDRMAKGVSRTGAQVVVLDTITVPQIKALGLPLALVLREAPYAALQRFRLPGNRPWDLVVVANPEAHWMPANAVLAARSVAPVGWIYRPTGPRQEAPAALPRVPVATGDGGTAETAHVLYAQIDALLALARYRSTRPFTVVQAIDPRAQAFGGLAQANRVVAPGGRYGLAPQLGCAARWRPDPSGAGAAEADLGNLAAWQATQFPGGLAKRVLAARELVRMAAPLADSAPIGLLPARWLARSMQFCSSDSCPASHAAQASLAPRRSDGGRSQP